MQGISLTLEHQGDNGIAEFSSGPSQAELSIFPHETPPTSIDGSACSQFKRKMVKRTTRRRVRFDIRCKTWARIFDSLSDIIRIYCLLRSIGQVGSRAISTLGLLQPVKRSVDHRPII